MNRIERKEKQLPPKRKILLASLREHYWKVLHFDDEYSDWALDEKWLIESLRENRGFTLELWFFKYNGKYDGMDRVVATSLNSLQPSPYSGYPSIEFDGRKFEKQLKNFLKFLHTMRIDIPKDR